MNREETIEWLGILLKRAVVEFEKNDYQASLEYTITAKGVLQILTEGEDDECTRKTRQG